MDPTSLFLGGLLSAAGLGFFVYGKKQQVLVPTLCGIALMVIPYLITNIPVLLVAGVALCVIPYFARS